MTTIGYTGVLVVEDCPVCGVSHAIPSGLQAQARRHGTSVFCPLGHSWHYTKTVEQELAEARNDATYYRDRLRGERQEHERTTRRLNATRGVVTRTKKRIAAGVCPCCHRHFTALERHMASQHPDYTTEAEAHG